MIGGLFYSRIQSKVNEDKQDNSKAAIQHRAYMAYMKDGEQQKNNIVTEDHEEGLDDSQRGLLPNSVTVQQSDAQFALQKGASGGMKQVKFASPSPEDHDYYEDQIKM